MFARDRLELIGCEFEPEGQPKGSLSNEFECALEPELELELIVRRECEQRRNSL